MTFKDPDRVHARSRHHPVPPSQPSEDDAPRSD
jgi:hypothetical protein